MAPHLLEIGAGKNPVGNLAPLTLPSGKPTMGFL